MTDYVSIVRNADIFTKSYKSNISESQKSAYGILKQATMNRKRSGLFVTIWCEAAKGLKC